METDLGGEGVALAQKTLARHPARLAATRAAVALAARVANGEDVAVDEVQGAQWALLLAGRGPVPGVSPATQAQGVIADEVSLARETLALALVAAGHPARERDGAPRDFARLLAREATRYATNAAFTAAEESGLAPGVWVEALASARRAAGA